MTPQPTEWNLIKVLDETQPQQPGVAQHHHQGMLAAPGAESSVAVLPCAPMLRVTLTCTHPNPVLDGNAFHRQAHRSYVDSIGAKGTGTALRSGR